MSVGGGEKGCRDDGRLFFKVWSMAATISSKPLGPRSVRLYTGVVRLSDQLVAWISGQGHF